jgi:hypothetical protein
MKRLLIMAIFIAGFTCNGQNLDEIVSKHIEAVGGADNWNKVKSIRMECSMKVQGSDIKITICQVDRVASRQDVEAMGKKGYSIVTTTEGWNFMPFWGHTKPEAITADELKSAQDDLSIRDEFITYKELGKSIEYIGKDDIEGIECYKIKMIDKDGQETTYYMDTESYYVIKQVDKFKADGKEMENTTMYSNFEKLNEGIVFPMAISGGWGVTDIVKLEINPKLEDSLFKLPAQ